MKVAIFVSNDVKYNHFRVLVKKDVKNNHFYRINEKYDDNLH